ncbi:MAG: Na(+)-translocating NADH-quinone reductase subunit A [Bacteroidales bacterium]|nr:Na(+)-translocating NADH-quinone reductase subunit A [Bacteroidales bacterium]
MSKVHKIKRGLNIPLIGKAEKVIRNAEPARYYGVKPIDFQGMRTKLLAWPGDRVKAGTSLFYNKLQPHVKMPSPVSGKVAEVNRGERRKILEVVIEPDSQMEYEDFGKGEPRDMSRDGVVDKLTKSGLWTFIRQRPYSISANPEDDPKAIFVSGFDTAPLAPDNDFILKGENEDFQRGIDALSKLTSGKIHLNLNSDYPPSDVFTKAKGLQINWFTGPHPAGNVGVQINRIDPINQGDLVWYVYPQDIITIGRLFGKGIYDASKVIGLTGSEVKKPIYYRLLRGASIENLVKDHVEPGNLRCISGNVLTGKKINSEGYLGFFDNQVTVIPEGNYHEFLGWAKPGFNKYSTSRTFFSWLQPKRRYRLDTNIHGGERAYVISGEYEKVFPMDIYPVQLIKAIMIEDIELMEKLGIYEVDEEDFALCEFVCTSKTPVQPIIRKGLDMMREEMT